MPGIQQLIASIDERRDHVPKSYWKDPLQKLFRKMDTDRDGYLSQEDVVKALQAEQCQVNKDQVHAFVVAEGYTDEDHINLQQFEQLLHDMAASDLQFHGREFAF